MTLQKMNVRDVTHELFRKIAVELPQSPSIPVSKRQRAADELVYLSLFLIDLGLYLSWHASSQRKWVMDSLWDLVSSSGLNMEVVNMRMEAYRDAAKSDTLEASFSNLGRTFAWHCLAQDDVQIAALGEQEARRLLEEITPFASSIDVTP
ncbi:hypothetical protein LLE49_17700 [Alicyclobacillus tolerans]|uniref:hypothetical protein n=1 Tax=Alicyclobacillus tolerans TaxID=90970 RepID=UPI001F1CB6CD|nr:hypothetical protein [Alicyclobacillus tolerans]MCF8566562.1 hypothetical protein [Alicyclobacillus tolerans]